MKASCKILVHIVTLRLITFIVIYSCLKTDNANCQIQSTVILPGHKRIENDSRKCSCSCAVRLLAAAGNRDHVTQVQNALADDGMSRYLYEPTVPITYRYTRSFGSLRDANCPETVFFKLTKLTISEREKLIRFDHIATCYHTFVLN